MRARLQFLIAPLAVAGCAVGPSTAIDAPTPRAVRPVDTLTAPAPRQFIDSLAQARKGAPPDTLAPLVREERVTLDTTTDLAWLRVLADTTLVRLVETAWPAPRPPGGDRCGAGVSRRGRRRAGRCPLPPGERQWLCEHQPDRRFPATEFDAIRITAKPRVGLDFWGRIRRQTQAAEFDLAGQNCDRRAVIVTLVSAWSPHGSSFLRADRSVDLRRRALASRRASLLDLSRRRFSSPGWSRSWTMRQFGPRQPEPRPDWHNSPWTAPGPSIA